MGQGHGHETITTGLSASQRSNVTLPQWQRALQLNLKGKQGAANKGGTRPQFKARKANGTLRGPCNPPVAMCVLFQVLLSTMTVRLAMLVVW